MKKRLAVVTMIASVALASLVIASAGMRYPSFLYAGVLPVQEDEGEYERAPEYFGTPGYHGTPDFFGTPFYYGTPQYGTPSH